eukprot:3908229-Amphidinium_carterae.2
MERRQQTVTKGLCLLRRSFGFSIGQSKWLPSTRARLNAQGWRMAVELAAEVYGGMNEHSKRRLLHKLEKNVGL